MKIRKAEMKDINQIVEIMYQVQKLHYENRPDIFKDKSINEIERQVFEILNITDPTIIVAENELQEIVGILIYKIKIPDQFSNLRPCKILTIAELGVEEKQRNKGIGKKLMQEAERIKDELGCDRLELNCWDFNKNAMEFYKSFGMKNQRTFFEK